jgi:enoyl-CoA hydratase/carnithine racemase
MVEAAEAREIGMVLEVVEPDELESSVQRLAEELAAGAPLAQAFIKRGLDRSLAATFEEMLAHETQAQALNLGSEDAVEGVAAFLGGRAPIFRGR